MPLNIAKTIGLFDEEEDKMITTKSRSISGKFGVYYTTIPSLKVLHKQTLFDEFRNPTIRILCQNQGIDFIILGRDLIFNRYDITFSDKRKKLILTKHKKKAKEK